jgi:hypothetical protein
MIPKSGNRFSDKIMLNQKNKVARRLLPAAMRKSIYEME